VSLSRAGLAPIALMLGAGLVASCTTVARAPGKTEIAELVLIDHACRVEDGKECKPEEQVKRVVVDDVRCRSLPLRAGVPEVSRAECRYEATLVRVDGQQKPLGTRTAEFGLLNYSPGARLGVYQWSKRPDQNEPSEATPE
jgi:hypothetical protein